MNAPDKRTGPSGGGGPVEAPATGLGTIVAPGIDTATPIDGPVAHVFVDTGSGRCVCGAPRFVGVHVAYDGTPVPDLSGIEDQLDVIAAAVAKIRAKMAKAVAP